MELVTPWCRTASLTARIAASRSMAELVRAATASALSAGLISRTGKIWINVRIVESRSATKKEPPAIFGRRLYRTTRGGATTKTNEEIVAAFQAGDQSALSELWANNERGVKYLADKIAAAGLGDAEDLLQEGFFGLLKAAEDYDPAEGVAFMTYAWQWLRNAMFGSIRATGSAIRLPSHIQEKIWRYRRFISEYQKSTGSYPSDAQICAVLSVDAAALAKIREALKVVTLASIDAPVADLDDSLTLGDSLAGAEDLEEDVGRRLDHERMAGELQRLIGRMDPEKQQALRVRFWGDRTLTPIELQKNKQALAELRSPSNRARLRPYYEAYLGSPYRGGLQRFRETGESITESLAIRRISRQEIAQDLDGEE